MALQLIIYFAFCLYDIWNLDVFRPYLKKFCISGTISTLQLLAIGYVTAVFPLLLAIIAFILAWLDKRGGNPVSCLLRPIKNCYNYVKGKCQNTDSKFQQSILHALATFILLSYTKFTRVSFILLTSTPLLHDNGTSDSDRLYYDGTITFGSPEHYPYLLCSVVVLLTFVAIPPLILIAPSIKYIVCKRLQHCNKVPSSSCCSCLSSWAEKLEEFRKTFYGCYKDGTNDGEIDCRWFAGWYFILRIIMLGLYAFTPDWIVQMVLQQSVCIVAFSILIIFRPYRNNLYSNVDAIFLCILALLCSFSLQNYYSSVQVETKIPKWTFIFQYFLLTIPHIYIAVVIVVFIYKNIKCKCIKTQSMKMKIKKSSNLQI